MVVVWLFGRPQCFVVLLLFRQRSLPLTLVMIFSFVVTTGLKSFNLLNRYRCFHELCCAFSVSLRYLPVTLFFYSLRLYLAGFWLLVPNWKRQSRRSFQDFYKRLWGSSVFLYESDVYAVCTRHESITVISFLWINEKTDVLFFSYEEIAMQLQDDQKNRS